MHEMNGFWYPWSGKANGSNLAATALYKQAFIRVHTIFQNTGATKVKFYFCVNNYSTTAGGGANESWNDMLNYYPGDQYVDYIGADVYNFAKNDPNVGSFASLYAEFQTKFGSVSSKPVIIGETGCADVGTGAGDSTNTYVSGSDVNKAAWLNAMATAINTQYTNIVAVVFFNIDKERRWQADSSSTALTAFQNMITGPRWITNGGPQTATSAKIATLQTTMKTAQTSVFRYDTGTSVVSNGTHITPGNGTYPTVKTFDTYDFTSSSLYVKLVPPVGGGATLQMVIDPGVGYGSDILISFDSGNATVARRSDYNWVDTKTPWVFTSGSYVKFTESGGTFTVSDSPDTVTWTQRVTISVGPNPVTSAVLSFLAYQGGSGVTDAIISNLNTTS